MPNEINRSPVESFLLDYAHRSLVDLPLTNAQTAEVGQLAAGFDPKLNVSNPGPIIYLIDAPASQANGGEEPRILASPQPDQKRVGEANNVVTLPIRSWQQRVLAAGTALATAATLAACAGNTDPKGGDVAQEPTSSHQPNMGTTSDPSLLVRNGKTYQLVPQSENSSAASTGSGVKPINSSPESTTGSLSEAPKPPAEEPGPSDGPQPLSAEKYKTPEAVTKAFIEQGYMKWIMADVNDQTAWRIQFDISNVN